MPARAKRVDETIGTWPTAWGMMGGARGAKGLRRIILPHHSPKDLRELLAWEHPGAATDDEAFADVAALCRDYFNRKGPDFADVPCDLSTVGPFARRILAACRAIPFGQRLTYAALARSAGEAGKARPAAQALGRNPIPLVIPCHRVVATGGGLGGFSAPGGVDLKARMLALESS